MPQHDDLGIPEEDMVRGTGDALIEDDPDFDDGSEDDDEDSTLWDDPTPDELGVKLDPEDPDAEGVAD
jgi:hypothetical protein